MNKSYEDTLFSVCQPLFAAILKRDAQTKEEWRRRLQTFHVHGLLDFLLPSPVQPKVLEIDQDRANNDARYRRYLIRKLKAPRPGKWVSVRMPIHPERFSEEQYLTDVSKVLAFKWVEKLLPVDSDVDRLVLLKLNEKSLRWCLDRMLRNHSDAPNVAARVMRMIAEECVDESPAMKRVIADMKSQTEPVVSAARDEIRRICQEAKEASAASLAQIAAEACARLEAYSIEMKRRSKEDADRSARVLAECAVPADREEEWRQALLRREREHREAYRRSPERWVWRGFFGGIAVLFGFFAEIEGKTPAEWVWALLAAI